MANNEYDPIRAGKKFRQVRLATSWGQQELAIEIGYSNNSQLSEFENGKGMLPMDKLQAASQAMGVPLFLLTNDRDYTDGQIDLIVKFFTKMIEQGDKYPHFQSVKSLLNS